jgi:hypothetical protein
VSKLPSPAEVIDVDRDKACTPAKQPPAQTSLLLPAVEATFNPTKSRAAKRISLLPWCLPIETSLSRWEMDSQLPAALFVFEPPHKEEAQFI